jgi:DNA-binding CsgD family transcriptional regulator
VTSYPSLPGRPLTPSEITVITLIANGHTTTAICRELNLTEHTIKTHRSRAYKKLGAHCLTEAVDLAIAAGYLQPSDIVTPDAELLAAQLRATRRQAGRYRAAWLSARQRAAKRGGVAPVVRIAAPTTDQARYVSAFSALSREISASGQYLPLSVRERAIRAALAAADQTASIRRAS